MSKCLPLLIAAAWLGCDSGDPVSALETTGADVTPTDTGSQPDTSADASATTDTTTDPFLRQATDPMAVEATSQLSDFARTSSALTVAGGELLREHLDEFLERIAEDSGRVLPGFVVEQLRAIIGCGDICRGFVRLRCDTCRCDRAVPFS